MKTGCIYRIIAPNGKSYIGQAVDYVRRMRRHKKMNDGCPLIKKAIKKYGWENMKKTILARNMTKEQMDREESNLIKIYDTFGENGYNLTKGGEGTLGSKPPPRTDKQRAVSSATMMGKQNALGCKHPPVTAETRAKQSAAATKLWEDPEHRANISTKMMGNTYGLGCKHRPRTDKFKVKQSADSKNLWKDPEWRENQVSKKTGQNNPMSATNIRRRFIAKCFDNKVFLWD